MRSFRRIRVLERLVFHLQPLEIDDPQVFVAAFPKLALSEPEHGSRQHGLRSFHLHSPLALSGRRTLQCPSIPWTKGK